MKAAFALGLLAGLFEFIPTVGPIVSALPAIAMAFLDSPEKALSVGIAYVGIQFFENHLLIPLLMKGGIDLPPALTVFSQALMALTFGFLGLMCAVPLLAATVVAVKMLYVEDVVGEQHVSPSRQRSAPRRASLTRLAGLLPLVKRFPMLGALPRVALGHFPTPIVSARRAGAVALDQA